MGVVREQLLGDIDIHILIFGVRLLGKLFVGIRGSTRGKLRVPLPATLDIAPVVSDHKLAHVRDSGTNRCLPNLRPGYIDSRVCACGSLRRSS